MDEPLANIASHLPQVATAQPDALALVIPQERACRKLNFGELESATNAAAFLLATRGLRRGQRVLLMVKPGLELILCVFALLKMGAVPVVIDPGMGRRNFIHCVRRTRPDALLGIRPALILSRLFRGSFASIRRRIAVGKQFEAQREAHTGKPFYVEATREDELAAILFTSGSTGSPKGVCYTHRMFEAQVEMIGKQYAIEPGGVDLPMLPVFALFNPAFGTTTVVPEMNPSRPASADPAKLVAAIREHGVTSSFGSPAVWSNVERYCRKHSITLPTIRRILMAGAPVPPGLIRSMKTLLPNGEIHTPYGATEVLPVSSIRGSEVLDETLPLTESGHGTCVGKPLPGVEVKIIAIDEGVIESLTSARELPEGEIGELIVTGPSVTKIYDNLPEATAKAKIADGERTWHRMGDLGYLDGGGRLWFCGRLVERVQTATGPLYTDCAEGIFNSLGFVFRSALIGLGEAPGQTPAVVVELYPKTDTSVNNPIEKLKEHAAQHELTRGIVHFFIHKKFPVDVRHNAKIHRLTLKKYYDRKLG